MNSFAQDPVKAKKVKDYSLKRKEKTAATYLELKNWSILLLKHFYDP